MTMVGNVTHEAVNRLISFAELEPRRKRNEPLDILVDLGATIEDHDEVMKHEFQQPSID